MFKIKYRGKNKNAVNHMWWQEFATIEDAEKNAESIPYPHWRIVYANGKPIKGYEWTHKGEEK